MGSAKRVEALGQLVPAPRLRPSFRPLAKIAELFSSNRPRKPLELVQDLASVVAARIAKRLQATDEPRAILYGLEDQGTQTFGIVGKQRP